MEKLALNQNRRIPIEKKIEAVNYAIMMNSNYFAAQKYSVSEFSIRYWRAQIKELEKASKKKEKITLHQGNVLSEETIKTDRIIKFCKN